MKNLYIIGARGFGREIYHLATQTNEYLKDYQIAGFLDDKEDALSGYDNYPPIISSVENYVVKEEDVFICALGDVIYKRKYIELILNKGGKFINLVHKDASISPNVKIGIGCIFSRYSAISCDVEIGNFNTFQAYSVLGHDVKVGDYCHFNTYAFVGGFAKIGNDVTLHTGAIIHPHKKVAEKAVVGASAVVIRNVAPNTTVYGNPAKKLII